MNRIIDISPEISEKIAVFPGDTKFSRQMLLDKKKGDNLTLSSITTTVHLGAHADAPNHYDKKGKGIAARPLDFYLGPCQVIRVKLKPGERILPKHLRKRTIQAPRVLFRTDSFPNPNRWNKNFNGLSPELILELHSKGVRLVGIDTPSIDPADSKELESHAALLACDMAVLEGIVLSEAEEKNYELIALPLRIAGADASPVRAILIEKKNCISNHR